MRSIVQRIFPASTATASTTIVIDTPIVDMALQLQVDAAVVPEMNERILTEKKAFSSSITAFVGSASMQQTAISILVAANSHQRYQSPPSVTDREKVEHSQLDPSRRHNPF